MSYNDVYHLNKEILKNLNEFINADVCMACGKCCEVFSLWIGDSEGIANRFDMMDGIEFEVMSTHLPSPFLSKLIFFKKKCQKLNLCQGKYMCEIFGKEERPQLCLEYPFNLFDWIEADHNISVENFMRYLEICFRICPSTRSAYMFTLEERVKKEDLERPSP